MICQRSDATAMAEPWALCLGPCSTRRSVDPTSLGTTSSNGQESLVPHLGCGNGVCGLFLSSWGCWMGGRRGAAARWWLEHRQCRVPRVTNASGVAQSTKEKNLLRAEGQGDLNNQRAYGGRRGSIPG